MPANEAEVTAHSQQMRDWAEHQRVRAGEMDGTMSGMGGMGGGGMGGMGPGSTFTCPTQ